MWLTTSSSGSRTKCSLPLAWHGEYFHLEYSKPLVVTNTSITEKGKCEWSSGSQYVLKGEDNGQPCWRCLSIHRKHQNVLQYKESDCEYQNQFGSLSEICSRIPGDGEMFSLFRRQAEPTTCPLDGPYMFSYAKGGTGHPCEYPKSYIDTCSKNTKMKLHYQACIDVKGSQSKTEEWKCVGSWREGSRGYFVGELVDDYMSSEKSRFRCFVYENGGGGKIKMAESGAATCNGLWTPTEGYKVFSMEKVVGEGNKCGYPTWFSRYHTWHNLAGDKQLHVNSGETSITIRSEQSDVAEHMSCHTVLPDSLPQSSMYTGYSQQPGISVAHNQDLVYNEQDHKGQNQPIYINSPNINYINSKENRATVKTKLNKDRPKFANSDFRNGLKSVDEYTGRFNDAARDTMDVLSKLEDEVSSHGDGDTGSSVRIVHHVKSGCDSGYVCTMISRLADNLVSLQTGVMSRDPRESCTDLYFSAPITSLYVARSHHSRPCSLNGRYTVTSTLTPHLHSPPSILQTFCPGANSFSSGCGSRMLKFRCDQNVDNSTAISDTKTDIIQYEEVEFQCHAHWMRDGGVSSLVMTRSGHLGYYCLTYSDTGINMVVGDCVETPVQYRYTQTGPCIQALSATLSNGSASTSVLMYYLTLWLVILTLHL